MIFDGHFMLFAIFYFLIIIYFNNKGTNIKKIRLRLPEYTKIRHLGFYILLSSEFLI